MRRMLFALKQAWFMRKCWRFAKGIDNVTQIDLKLIQQLNIKVLALDFDGVLASHGEQVLHPNVKIWLDDFVKSFDMHFICILSNKPNSIREAYFKANYPGIVFIKGPKKKPYPDGLMAIQTRYQVAAREVTLVDDRLLTGVLACCLAQTGSLYITNPYVNFKVRPIKESFFYGLRWLERRFYQGTKKAP